jgi:hypothetical protein
MCLYLKAPSLAPSYATAPSHAGTENACPLDTTASRLPETRTNCSRCFIGSTNLAILALRDYLDELRLAYGGVV